MTITMTIDILYSRADNKCELCGSCEKLVAHKVPPNSDGSAAQSIVLCDTCNDQIEHPEKTDINHWRCLNDSMWNQVPAVQVMVWRILTRLRNENWAQNLLDMLYLDDDTLSWAQAGEAIKEETVKHLDANGAKLSAGDTVVLVKDLNVKGAGFTAKRGTAVRNISLVADNAAQIEGRVNSQQIVILTEFVKRSG
jgi:protein PhnA